ncbi:tetratricopeptide repeat protein [Paeniglutamicibacter terrestris]|uniref:Tetratricopeptide repeat protein n=1 Tax=Paeniglutamicibacter terrestris TaxID=2723403 RepID=A0ABX1GAI4_9MICC|nr:tetratricopeptide repeat protein [Paeniglutamicibacter terrestris]NKG22586.1 tetratricopeptide repeat protein [Paeniglutamicibacter terrestris]
MTAEPLREPAQQTSYVIDPLTLREVVNDANLVEARIDVLERGGTAGDSERIAWLRMLGRLSEAETLGWSALIRSGGASSTGAVTNPLPYGATTAALRLAHVMHWQERYDEANELFSMAQTAAESAVSDPQKPRRVPLTIAAFAHQHRGKMYYEQHRFDQALDEFQTALALREEANSPADQIASTLLAIKTSKARIAATAAAS